MLRAPADLSRESYGIEYLTVLWYAGPAIRLPPAPARTRWHPHAATAHPASGVLPRHPARDSARTNCAKLHVRTQGTPSAPPSSERQGRRRSPRNEPVRRHTVCTNEISQRHVRTRRSLPNGILHERFSRCRPPPRRPEAPRAPVERAKKDGLPQRAAVQSLRGTMELLHPENARVRGSFHG